METALPLASRVLSVKPNVQNIFSDAFPYESVAILLEGGFQTSKNGPAGWIKVSPQWLPYKVHRLEELQVEEPAQRRGTRNAWLIGIFLLKKGNFNIFGFHSLETWVVESPSKNKL